MTPLTLVFVMDPIGSVDIDADTTFALMLEAQRRGHRVLAADPLDLGVAADGPTVRATPVELRRERGNHVDFGEPRTLVLDDDADVVLQRKDPPVDAAYVTATQILGLCQKARVLNRPQGILAANEKLYAMQFRDLMPATLVSRHVDELLGFLGQHGDVILKPLDGKGGEGIFHIHRGDRNLFSILEQSTGFGARPAMAQEYLPGIRQGDKRVLLVDGEPLGALLRIPADHEVRANLHVGGRAVKAAIDAADQRIIDRLCPLLRRDGLFFVGIDVIQGKLTEVNVTSPTGIQEMGRLDGQAYEARVIDAIEQLRADG